MKTATAGAAIVLLLAVGHPAHAAPPDDDEAALLQRFAPILAVRRQSEPCGDGERYLPVAVDVVLGRDDVVLREPGGGIVARAPTAADLAGGGEDRWLDLPGDALDPGCSYERWFDSLGAAPAMYGRLTSEADQLVAQYWFFWVYNQWNDLHEGDWEMVQLVFDTESPIDAMTAGPTLYAYAQHEGSQYVTAGGDLTLVDGVRPVVFAAQGSHASFFESSHWFGKSAATGFGCDDTSGPLDQVDPQLLLLPGDDVPTSGDLAWLSYRGHWGQQEPAFNNGPTGPVTKVQWSAPVTWVEDEGRDSAVPLPFAGSRATRTFCDLSTSGSMLFNRFLRSPLLVVATLVVVVTAVVLIVRGSSRGVLGRAARTWRAEARRLLPVGALVAVGAVAGVLLQHALLRWTPMGTLVDGLGASSAWVAPVLALVGSLVAVPVWALAAAVTIRAVRKPSDDRPVADVLQRRRPAVWTVLVLAAVTGLALVAFPPLIVLASRWLAGPVAAVDERATARAALRTSHRLVRGHGWRAVGMLVTMVLLASIAGVVGALVLVLTPLTFTAAAVATTVAGIVLVPYLALVTLAFHDDITAAPSEPRSGQKPR